MHENEKPVKEFEEKIIVRDRVARVVKGGRRQRTRVLVVIGDRKGRVGFGIGKAEDASLANAKAITSAKKNIITVPIFNDTIPHEITAKSTGAIIMLKPAGKGTSVIAGGAVRAVVELAGIKNILSKSLGSSNAINVVTATFEALKGLKSRTPKLKEENVK
jgi:small subunit ribosomal protein S5